MFVMPLSTFVFQVIIFLHKTSEWGEPGTLKSLLWFAHFCFSCLEPAIKFLLVVSFYAMLMLSPTRGAFHHGALKYNADEHEKHIYVPCYDLTIRIMCK